MPDRILILDFGSQVTQLIARRVRESGVYCEIHPYTIGDDKVRDFDPRAIILSGGPASVTEGAAPRAPAIAFRLGVPVLGICYGMQTMCDELGGRVALSEHQEFGRAFIDILDDCPLFDGLWPKGGRAQVWMSHGDKVDAVPAGFRAVAASEAAPFAAIADDERRFYGFLFHPEVAHTPQGAELLHNFTHKVAGCRGDWTMASFRADAIERIREQVGHGHVVCGLSGGVDSAVAAALLHEAVGDQLTCIFVDTGLLRAGEAEEVVDLFRRHYNIPLVHRDAGDLFLAKLAGVTDPEEKRKRIGATFIDVFDEEAQKLGDVEFLAQGTLYPDVIEFDERHRRPFGHDQVAPQCRRPARADEAETGRAVARIVQGRGARIGPRARPARAAGRDAIRSPARAWRSASPARSPARGSKSCARPMRSLSKRSATPGSTTRSGRPSPCCCRSGASASWATRAPTTMSARCAR